MTAHDKVPTLYLSAPHGCPYLDDKISTTLLVDPHFNVTAPLYSTLIKQGFRRSGTLFYRPHCEQCSACVSVRIPTHAFEPSQSQKRVWRRNRDLSVKCASPKFRKEHFDLYLRYQSERHTGGNMDDPDPEKYNEFMVESSVDSFFIEMRLQETLAAVAVCDRVEDGISAIYTFFDPDLSKRSLGTFAIMWQVEYAKTLNLPWVYLGYWINDCNKMSYKDNFRPLQGFRNGRWQTRPS